MWIAISAIATVVYALFSMFQWLTIKRQADNLDRSIGVTERAVDAANRNATAAFDNAESAKKLAEVAAEQRELMKGQLQAAQDAAVAAQLSSDIARDALHLKENADIQLRTIDFDIPEPYPDGFINPVVTMVWHNYGRTVAKNVSADFTLGIPEGKQRKQFPDDPAVMIAAGQTSNYGFSPMRQIIDDPAALAAIIQGQVTLRVWGTLTYQTVFGGNRTIEAGATWIRGTSAFRWDQYEMTETFESKDQPKSEDKG